jgi:hypothetical protein
MRHHGGGDKSNRGTTNSTMVRLLCSIHITVYDVVVETEVAHVKKITKESLLKFYMQFFHPDSTTRIKLSVHIRSQRLLPKIAEHKETVSPSIVSQLKQALVEYHGIVMDDDAIVGVVGSELGVSGSASLSVGGTFLQWTS